MSPESVGDDRRGSIPASAALTAVEALSECGLALHVAEAVVHDLDLIGWEVRPARDLATAKDAALRALADYTGLTDPEQPWWNLNMPKALDIMLPAILGGVVVSADPTATAAPMGLSHYELRRLSDGTGLQVSQNGKAIYLDWAAVSDLGFALIDAQDERDPDV